MASSSEAGGYKTQICRYWPGGNCIYGHKCWFSHGIEEQRRHLANTGSAEAASTNSSIKAKPAAEVAATTSSTNSPIKATLAAEAAAAVASTNSSIKATPAAEVAATTSSTNSPIKATLAAEAAATVASTTSNIGCNWSPQDDGIEIKPLPSSTTGKPPSREEVDAYLEADLYGPKIKERIKWLPKLLPD